MLRYLPTNLSRHEIAGELSVSVNTVSTHLRSIYAKLGANDRSEAVHRARELRLLTSRPLPVAEGAEPERETDDHRIPVMRSHLPALDHGVMDPAPAPYIIRINGHLGATVLSAFPAMAPHHHGAHTVLTGLLDRSALYGVLAKIDALGLDLLEVRHLPRSQITGPGDSRLPASGPPDRRPLTARALA